MAKTFVSYGNKYLPNFGLSIELFPAKNPHRTCDQNSPTCEDAMATVHPFLWFNLDAEAARDFYLSVFKNSRALGAIEFTDKPHAIFDFELEGQRFTALNAGGVPPFNERISLYIETGDQK
ncbi:MAG: hypothetical protein E5X69_12360 [Mesorhizobium sp.]|nr:MAG: hypothetical protein E5X69_12360 [Mesorhizobium sp.]